MARVSKEAFFRLILSVFVFTIPVSQGLSIKLLILSVLASLILVRKSRWIKGLVSSGWDLVLYFAVLIFGLLYTEDMESGLGALERNLSFVMVPILFSRINSFDKATLNRLCGLFTAGIMTASIICLGYAMYRDLYLNIKGVYYYEEFTAIIDSHPTYMAYYLCFSIIFLIYLMSYEITTRPQRILIVIGVLFLSSILVCTAGKSTYVSLLMMASFFFMKLLLESNPIRSKVQGISLTILLLAIIAIQSPIGQRTFTGVISERSGSIQDVRGDAWERIVLWESGFKASPNLFLGVGTGDYRNVMNEYYRMHKLEKFADVNFNTHNQFIQALFSNGILGMLAVMTILLRPIYIAARRQNILGMLTFFPFLIYGISEVFLGRYQGIIFFVVLHQIFIKYLNINLEPIAGGKLQKSF